MDASHQGNSSCQAGQYELLKNGAEDEKVKGFTVKMIYSYS